ncbi:MAG: metabolite traffic protein EboE [Verrucomicrobiales bacterium]
MKIKNNLHLAYCTNIHRGETWAQTFETLQKYTLRVRDNVANGQPYAIGLRLGDDASRELSKKETLLSFQRWLEKENCYIFTINGFPYGKFHGERVKEHVFQPDWTTQERVTYTNRLFDLLGELVPAGIEGSVSTVPCSYKEFIHSEEQIQMMRQNVWSAVEHIDKVSKRTGKLLHLGLEPEPLCYVETSGETIEFINQCRGDRPQDDRINQYLGINYDTCHLAIEYEDPVEVVKNLRANEIKISKLHFSSALKVIPTKEVRTALKSFVDVVYFHQVIARLADGSLKRYRDLDVALDETASMQGKAAEEWRIHFHIPLHSKPNPIFDTTADHILGVMDLLAQDPSLCSHLEMETYTWEVLPSEMKKDVVDQLSAEYQWTLGEMGKRGLA